jgi:hypothetical protein
VHGELLTLGITVAPSTVWEILREAGIDPAPERAATTWADFLRCQAEALLAADFIETVTLTGTRLYILAVIEHATRRIRILGATTPPHCCMGHPGRPQPRHGPARHRVERPLPHPGPRREVPGAVRRDPRRQRDHGRAQRRPHAPHERGHGTVGTHLPPRTTRPNTDLEFSATSCTRCVSTRSSTTHTDRTRASTTPGHSSRCPNRSPTNSPSYASVAVTVSAASCTSTNTRGTVPQTVFPARHAGPWSGGMGTVSDDIEFRESTEEDRR